MSDTCFVTCSKLRSRTQRNVGQRGIQPALNGQDRFLAIKRRFGPTVILVRGNREFREFVLTAVVYTFEQVLK